jgi:hypothetical protein
MFLSIYIKNSASGYGSYILLSVNTLHEYKSHIKTSRN